MVQAGQGSEVEDVRAQPRVTPPVDVFENDDEILLVVDVPGVDEDGVDVQLREGTLHLEARQAKGDEDVAITPVVYARSFTVPRTVDPGAVAAELDLGVLTVHLPKAEAAKPRRIEIKSA
ncbi:MAG TPA: Hsp20/alpha crystallin family protein [Polyangiaceae bacterium]|nr:Hsp20/alpha crystallin family protein [Polyangiaceae bacterium]